MFFRKKSDIGTENVSALTSYALIPVYRGKTKSVIGDRIVKLIQKSNFCSSNPFIKRLILKNVEVCCVVFETSGVQSLKIIFASVPYMVNLLSRTNPKFKAFLEDGRVVPYINFFKEIDFESVLSSLCTATVIIQSGIQKCYPIICVQLGREVLMFSKSSLHYILQLLLEGALYAIHYICEDLPHVLQSLCEQNYTVAKYCIRNLPLVALVGAKQFILFTLFVQRVVTASLKSLKRIARLLCHALINASSDIDVSKLCQDLLSILKLFAKCVISTSAFRSINFSLFRFFNWCLPLLKKSAPFILKESNAFVRKITPLLKQLINQVRFWLMKLYSFVERNKDTFIYVYYCAAKYMKLLLRKVKPFSCECYQIFLSSLKHLSELGPYVVHIINDMYYVCKSFIQDEHIQKLILTIFFKIKEHVPEIQSLVQRVYYTLMTSFKFNCKVLRKNMSYLILLIQKIFSSFFCLYQEFSPFVRPMMCEVSSVFNKCSKEVATKTACCFKHVVPSVWHGMKTITPVTFDASCEVAFTLKTSVSTVYPVLLKAALIISPEVKKGLFVVLRDGSKAYMEVVHSSYLVSREALLVTKSVSKELPLVLKAVSEVTLTTSGAISEVISTSSKAGIRACKDVHGAVKAVRSSLDSAELELLTTASEIAFNIESIVSDHKEILEVTVLLKKTSRVVVTITSKRCYSSLKNVSALSSSVVKCTVNAIPDKYRFIKYINSIELQSELLSRILLQFLGFKGSTDQSVKNLTEKICLICSNFVINSMSSTSDVLFKVMYAVLQNLCIVTPKIWKLSKDTNTTLWFYFCQSAFNLWTCLEQTSTVSWHVTCAHVPELWNSCKLLSYKTWVLSCDLSPVLCKTALPIFPVLWSAHCGAVQYVWEIHVRTCNKTWKLVVPLSSASWASTVQTLPKLWLALCENIKTSWGNLCDSVEFGWNATTRSSSLSWHLVHKTVSKSWKHALRPVTTSTCYNLSSAIAKSIKISYNVCAETKKWMYFL